VRIAQIMGCGLEVLRVGQAGLGVSWDAVRSGGAPRCSLPNGQQVGSAGRVCGALGGQGPERTRRPACPIVSLGCCNGTLRMFGRKLDTELVCMRLVSYGCNR